MYDGQKELGKSAEVLLLVEFGHAWWHNIAAHARLIIDGHFGCKTDQLKFVAQVALFLTAQNRRARDI